MNKTPPPIPRQPRADMGQSTTRRPGWGRVWRQGLAIAAGGLLAVMAMAASPTPATSSALPAGNLQIEWRVVSRALGQAQDRGRVWSSASASNQDESVQRIWVSNGGQAKLYMGRSVPSTSWQLMLSANPAGQSATQSTGQSTVNSASGAAYAAGTAQLLSQTTWVDLGQGVLVRPRWPGGQALVQVELDMQSKSTLSTSALSAGAGAGAGATRGGGLGTSGWSPDGAYQRREVSTVLSVPMGLWVVVAQSGVRQQQRTQGSWSTSRVEEELAEQFEMRVTVPERGDPDRPVPRPDLP